MHDLKSGHVAILPTNAEFISLVEIIDESFIDLQSSGRNGVSPYTTFPYLIHFFGNTKAVEVEPAFHVQNEDRFFSAWGYSKKHLFDFLLFTL